MRLTAIEQEIMKCEGCSIFDPDGQPSVRKRLKNGWDPIVWTMYNGRTISMGKGNVVALSSGIVACKMHEDILITRGGWDGTGSRQS